MLVADSHEYIETYRGDRDLRLGMELVRLREDLRFVSFGPEILSPEDSAVLGRDRQDRAALPDLPERMELRLLPARTVRFRRGEAGGKFALQRGYGRALASLAPDVIMENPYTWLTPRSYTTHRVARSLGAPVVYYDPGDDVPISLKQRALARFERGVIRDAHAIITFNGAGKRRFMRKYGCPEEQVRVVPKPVDVTACRSRVTAEEARARLALPTDSFVVAYVGRLARIKGSAVLAEVARRSAEDPDRADWRFLFLGGTLASTEDAADYESANALVTGMVPHSDVPDLLAAADVVAFPDLTHPGGFWTSIAEAMAAGKAIIVGAPPEQDFVPLEDGRTALLVPSGDAGALEAALRRLRDEAGLRRALSEAVGMYAEENMDYPRVAAAYLAVLEEALSGESRA